MIRLNAHSIWLGLLLLAPCDLMAQTREEKVRGDKARVEAEGIWIYGDFPRALEQAKEKGKPIMAVLRCIPCEECVKLDDELIDGDARIKPLLEKFVRVRIISTNGLDLSLFQFDTDQSFAIFFLNAEGTIYGRFGTRSHRTNWVGDVSIEGLARAMEGALELHQGFPGNKETLAAKRGPAPEFARPELLPKLKDKYNSTIDYKGKVVPSCIHCHQVGEAQREVLFSRGRKLPDEVLFPYPHPKILGLTFDPKERATVMDVEKGSVADQAGIRAGDRLVSLQGQPLLSIADVQWVLHHTPAQGGKIAAMVQRQGNALPLELSLDSGWRTRGDIEWRVSTWELRRKALGGMKLEMASAAEKEKAGGEAGKLALLVRHVGEYPPHNLALQAGVRKGDLLVGFDGRTDFTRETDLIAYTLREKQAGDPVTLEVIRGGSKRSLKFTLPK